jgi:hypothetical protein
VGIVSSRGQDEFLHEPDLNDSMVPGQEQMQNAAFSSDAKAYATAKAILAIDKKPRLKDNS